MWFCGKFHYLRHLSEPFSKRESNIEKRPPSVNHKFARSCGSFEAEPNRWNLRGLGEPLARGLT